VQLIEHDCHLIAYRIAHVRLLLVVQRSGYESGPHLYGMRYKKGRAFTLPSSTKPGTNP
jgi:hypothetical protein